MTLIHHPPLTIIEPGFFATGPHAPQVADRTLREEHADISALLLLASEIARAEVLGLQRWATQLRSIARGGLPTRPGTNADIWRAELSAVRAELTAAASDRASADSRARATARAGVLVHEYLTPNLVLTEWLAYRVAAQAGDRRAAARMLRQHLLCYGIDPTAPAAIAGLDRARRDEFGGPQWMHLGVLVAPGAYVWTDPTESLTDTVQAGRTLSWREKRVLRRGRAVEVTAAQWQDQMVQVLDSWTTHIPGDAR